MKKRVLSIQRIPLWLPEMCYSLNKWIFCWQILKCHRKTGFP